MKEKGSGVLIVTGAALAVLLVLGGLLAGSVLSRPAPLAAAQTENPTPMKPDAPQVSQITVVGTGSVSARPDELEITIGVAEEQATVKAAQAKVDKVTAAMIQKLKDAGIADSDYATSQYSVDAVYNYDNPKFPNGKLEGYRVTSLFDIIFRDPSKAPTVIDALTTAGANTINGTYFTFSDQLNDTLGKQAYDGAMKGAQERAEKLASLSNMTLGRIVSVSEVAATPNSQSLNNAGSGGVGFKPDEQTISASVIVTYEALPAK